MTAVLVRLWLGSHLLIQTLKVGLNITYPLSFLDGVAVPEKKKKQSLRGGRGEPVLRVTLECVDLPPFKPLRVHTTERQ